MIMNMSNIKATTRGGSVNVIFTKLTDGFVKELL